MAVEAKVLIFSDSSAEAENIKRVLEYASAGREIRVANEAGAARSLLAAESFDLIFVHSSGGALASTGFLDEVWKQSPKTTRFLVADSSVSSDALVRCVLGAHQFIARPIEPQSMREALARANAIRRFVRNEKIQPLVARMRTLPSRPSLYLEVIREVRSASASAAAVGELVARDFAISTKLIQVANSAFFGQEQKVSDPSSAVLLLGLEMTGALVLSIEAFARFDKVKPLYFSIDRVWKHSQTIAELAKSICETMGCDAETCGQAYTAGLLHDIGKLAIAQNFEEQYQRAVKQAEDTRTPVCDIEDQQFGANHAEAGAYLLALWGLPLPIVEAVADHHVLTGELTPPFSASTALHLAEQIAGVPERFEEIAAGYPAEFGLLPRLDDLRVLFGLRPNAVTLTENQPQPAETVASESVEVVGVTSTAAEPQCDQGADESSPEPVRRYRTYAVFALGAALLVMLSFSLGRRRDRSEASRRVSVADAAKRPESPGAEPVKSIVPSASPGPEAAADLKLQAILINKDKSSLLLNGVTLHVGEQIAGWEVVEIERQQVTLARNGLRRILTLQ